MRLILPAAVGTSSDARSRTDGCLESQHSSGRNRLHHLARLRVVLGLHKPSVLVCQDVVLAGPEVRRDCVGAILAEIVGTKVGRGASLDGTVGSDHWIIAEGIGDDSAAVFEDLLRLVERLQVWADGQGCVIQPVDLVEVVQAGVALLLVGNLLEHYVQRRQQSGGGRDVWICLGVNQLLAELRGAADRCAVQGCHALVVLVVHVGLLLEDTVKSASALAPAGDGHEFHVRGHLLAWLDVRIPLPRNDDRHGKRSRGNGAAGAHRLHWRGAARLT
mmetsp:Transcript_30963/g.97321  ORF Transcript_30963/g.97321 Transcript_30963/m.97321 type:complete len:275 (+) Transcript_30963:123-947(+)